jgi:ferredoxin
MPTPQKSPGQFDVFLANRGGACFAVDGRLPLLDALEDQGVSLPYGCRYGGCVSCAAKLLSGEVDQRAGVALNSRQIAAGYVLLCVARPLSDCTLEVGVDSHDKLYRNPFKDPTEAERWAVGTRSVQPPSD